MVCSNTGMLCPTGLACANYDEWTTLINYLGGTNVAGGAMKSTATGNGTDNGLFQILEHPIAVVLLLCLVATGTTTLPMLFSGCWQLLVVCYAER